VLPDGRRLDGSLVTSSGWITQVALQRLGAQLAVRSGSVRVAGIIGCHLLLRAMATDGSGFDPQRYDEAVRRLRALVGTDHPDVEALSLRCADPALRTGRHLVHPPMFADGWRLLIEASYNRPELVPPELGRRVQAASRLGPLLVWAADDDTRAAHADLLSEWINQYAVADAGTRESAGPPRSAAPSARMPQAASAMADAAQVPRAAREAGRRLQVPSTVVGELWEGRSGPR
jgi:hypothetical protein